MRSYCCLNARMECAVVVQTPCIRCPVYCVYGAEGAHETLSQMSKPTIGSQHPMASLQRTELVIEYVQNDRCAMPNATLVCTGIIILIKAADLQNILENH